MPAAVPEELSNHDLVFTDPNLGLDQVVVFTLLPLSLGSGSN